MGNFTAHLPSVLDLPFYLLFISGFVFFLEKDASATILSFHRVSKEIQPLSGRLDGREFLTR